MGKTRVIAIDFDGTITKENLYPKIGDLRENAKRVINKLAKDNVICIWTCREGKQLEDVYKYLNLHEITYHYINASPYDNLNPDMRKIIADIYIDDHNLYAEGNIDWKQIEKYFYPNNKKKN